MLAAVAAASLGAQAALAHIPTYGVGTASVLTFQEDRVHILFDLSYDGYWAQAEMIEIDKDRSRAIEGPEADAYLQRRWEGKISSAIRLRLDGVELDIRVARSRHEGLLGEIDPRPFSLYYEIEAAYPPGVPSGGEAHLLELHDGVVREETPAKPRFLIPYGGHATGRTRRFRPVEFGPIRPALQADGYSVESETLTVRFVLDPVASSEGEGTRIGDTSAAAPPSGKVSSAAAPPPSVAPAGRAGAGDREAHEPESDRLGEGPPLPSGLEDALRKPGGLRWYEVLASIAIALVAGAGHALAPGHGKAMVAAYLIGTQGRTRDAVALGLVTTLTHTGSVFLFGLALFLVVSGGARASEGALQNRVIVMTQLASGLLLFALGLILFFRRIRARRKGEGSHGHSHPHAHPHSHVHAQPPSDGRLHSHAPTHPHEPQHSPPPSPRSAVAAEGSAGLLRGGAPRLRDLLALGFSGGLVPCPAGLTVILIGLHFPDKLLFAIFLLIFFSLGLGSVLVSIGVALITGKAMLATRGGPDAFFRELPILRRVLPEPLLAALDRNGLRLLRALPVLSSLFIAALGAFFFASTFARGGTEIAATLRALAAWIEDRG